MKRWIRALIETVTPLSRPWRVKTRSSAVQPLLPRRRSPPPAPALRPRRLPRIPTFPRVHSGLHLSSSAPGGESYASASPEGRARVAKKGLHPSSLQDLLDSPGGPGVDLGSSRLYRIHRDTILAQHHFFLFPSVCEPLILTKPPQKMAGACRGIGRAREESPWGRRCCWVGTWFLKEPMGVGSSRHSALVARPVGMALRKAQPRTLGVCPRPWVCGASSYKTVSSGHCTLRGQRSPQTRSSRLRDVAEPRHLHALLGR